MNKTMSFAAALGAVILLGACGGKTESGAGASTAAAAPAAAPATGAQLTPAAGGKVIEVEMITDSSGNYFKPKDFTAKQGDVIRYVLKLGVHNANFLPDSNAGKTGLPAAGPILQLPGQTYDVAVSFKPGSYYYQCDAHAALGMKGHVTVQ